MCNQQVPSLPRGPTKKEDETTKQKQKQKHTRKQLEHEPDFEEQDTRRGKKFQGYLKRRRRRRRRGAGEKGESTTKPQGEETRRRTNGPGDASGGSGLFSFISFILIVDILFGTIRPIVVDINMNMLRILSNRLQPQRRQRRQWQRPSSAGTWHRFDSPTSTMGYTTILHSRQEETYHHKNNFHKFNIFNRMGVFVEGTFVSSSFLSSSSSFPGCSHHHDCISKGRNGNRVMNLIRQQQQQKQQRHEQQQQQQQKDLYRRTSLSSLSLSPSSSFSSIPHRCHAFLPSVASSAAATTTTISTLRRYSVKTDDAKNVARQRVNQGISKSRLYMSNNDDGHHHVGHVVDHHHILHELLSDWKNHPSINPTITFPTILVNDPSELHYWISEPKLSKYLAKPPNMEWLHHVHPRIKMVQDYHGHHPAPTDSVTTTMSSSSSMDDDDDDNKGETKNNTNRKKKKGQVSKLILLVPATSGDGNDEHDSSGLSSSSSSLGLLPESVWKELQAASIQRREAASTTTDTKTDGTATPGTDASVPSIDIGPTLSMSFNYRQLSFAYIMNQLLSSLSSSSSSSSFSSSFSSLPTAYEQIGHIAHFNLKEEFMPYGELIGQVLVATHPTIETVLTKVGQVYGKYRIFDYQILANTRKTRTTKAKTGKRNRLQQNRNDEDDNDNDDDSLYPFDDSILETTVIEHGIHIHLHVGKCYWNTRLSGERQLLLKEILSSSIPKGITTTKTKLKTDVDRTNHNDDDDDNLVRKQNTSLWIADPFCGVGAICLLLAKEFETIRINNKKSSNKRKKMKQQQRQEQEQRQSNNGDNDDNADDGKNLEYFIWANDWNPTAIEYFHKSIEKNNLKNHGSAFTGDSATAQAAAGGRMIRTDSRFQLSCGDAYDFLIELGLDDETNNEGGRIGMDDDDDDDDIDYDNYNDNSENDDTSYEKKRPKTRRPGRVPDHILMNYPLEGPTFLGALRWWSWRQVQAHHDETGRYPRFHVYTFARPDGGGGDAMENTEEEEEVAVNIIAHELLPLTLTVYIDDNDESSPSPPSIPRRRRRRQLNDEFQAQVHTRLVRDVAPGKVVVCVSFSVTPKLVRYMQGDYFDADSDCDDDDYDDDDYDFTDVDGADDIHELFLDELIKKDDADADTDNDDSSYIGNNDKIESSTSTMRRKDGK